jgi:hypothetical protein
MFFGEIFIFLWLNEHSKINRDPADA